MNKKPLNIINENSTETGISRRNFLKVLGSGIAATAAVGCADSPKQNILPLVKGDDEIIPGEASWFKSSCTQCSAGCGVMLRNREGRVVKIEGNPDHPINKGGLCALGHSALQAHYDPDRVREPLLKDKETKTFKPISWEAAFAKIASVLNKEGKKSFISEGYTGSIKKLISEFSATYGVQTQSFNLLEQTALSQAAELVYGVKGIPAFDFENAEVILNFGADFMETFVSPVEYSRAWSKSRKSEHPARFIQIEPRLSLTGANADTWLNCKPGTEILIALAVIKELLNRGVKGNAGYETLNNLHELTAAVNLETVASQSGIAREKIISAAGYLAQAKSSLVIAGGVAAGNNALALQSLVALINVLLGNVGKTVKLDRVRKVGTDFAALRSLIAEVEKGEHVLMFVDGSNPIFTLPSSYNLSLALQKLDLLVVCSSNIDETAALADIILPISSALESWGDSEPCEGINNLTQPAMAPIFNTRSLGDIFIGIDKSAKKSLGEYADFLAYLKNSWVAIQRANSDYGSFDSFWDVSVERGGAFRSVNAVSASYVNSKVFDLDFKVSEFSSRKLSESNSLVLLPFSSVRSFDGRAANRPWMQEIPDPITQIAWDSWAEINPKTARKLNLKTGDLVKVSNYFGEVNVPAYITEYVNENVIAVPIGNGHTELGRYASSVKGGNVINLIDSEVKSDFNGVPLLSANVALRRARGKHTLVITQGSDSQLGRDLARTKHLGHGESHDSGHGAHGAAHHEPEQMYEQRVHPLYRWGLAVDLAACNGCSACVAACYSENNIPTVGKRTMSKGREMTWLRIERYHDGSAEELQVSFLPMMCQHCNNAPCEPVCPVYATYHTEEGLNAMIYNRCVGTRYCSNNCTYKVRRFNWYEFSFPTPLDLQLNPDVMKRTAGVMEKCTFCVQRIAEVKDKAKDAGRPVLDGEVKPACVQSCPTEALVFGDLNDPNSRVSKLAKNQRAYKVLDHHLNTQPAVTYLEDVKYKA